MKSFRRYSLMILMISLSMIAACRQETTATHCDQVIDRHLLNIDFAKLTTPEQVRQWAKENYGVSDAVIEFQDNIPGQKILYWYSVVDSHAFYWMSSGKTMLRFDWGTTNNTSQQGVMGQVLGCLGEPTHYRAGYFSDGRQNLEIELWYLNRGIMVRAHRGQSLVEGMVGIIPTVTEDLPVVSVFVATPRDIRSVYQELYNERPIKPWPGSLEKIEVEAN